ncbi:hypothetical protein ONZ45_g8252 [Pleurotus djamor]|nr:hypothetical protein ONZ45_g8252 [Pleurotus djamor]
MANLVLAALRSESPLARVQLGDYVRHLDITVSSRRGFDYLVATFQIMRLCPNMRHITGRWNCELPKEYLSAISKLYGGSLKGLNWINEVSPDTVPFFGTFSSLRTLDLRDISGQVERFEASSPASRPCLPRVNTLVLSSSFSPFFASLFSFPSLENITVEAPPPSPLFNERLSKMLAVHGHTIITVDILPPQIHGDYDDRGCDLVDPSLFLNPATCPNLHSLTFPQASKQPFVHSHPNIRRIGIRAIKSDYLYPNKSSSTKDHLMAINRDLYPNLEVVRTVGFLVDSCGDSLIKDIFIWWAERFEGQGIDFQDGEGVIWLYNEAEAEPDPLPDEQPIAPSLAPISSS